MEDTPKKPRHFPPVGRERARLKGIETQKSTLDAAPSPESLKEKKRLSWLRVQASHKKLLIEFIRKAGGNISESRIAIESALIWISTMRATTAGGKFITIKSRNGTEVVMGSGVLKAGRKKLTLTCIGLLGTAGPDGPATNRKFITVQIQDTKSRTSPTCWESDIWC